MSAGNINSTVGADQYYYQHGGWLCRTHIIVLNNILVFQNESREGCPSDVILSPESSLGSATSSGNISEALVIITLTVFSFVRRSELDAGEPQSADDHVSICELNIVRRNK